jgi:hypothetical protein
MKLLTQDVGEVCFCLQATLESKTHGSSAKRYGSEVCRQLLKGVPEDAPKARVRLWQTRISAARISATT